MKVLATALQWIGVAPSTLSLSMHLEALLSFQPREPGAEDCGESLWAGPTGMHINHGVWRGAWMYCPFIELLCRPCLYSLDGVTNFRRTTVYKVLDGLESSGYLSLHCQELHFDG